MLYTSVNLNGCWEMDYSSEPFSGEISGWDGGFPVENAVPGYWEEMVTQFQKAPFFKNLRVNPEYGFQRYPIAGTAPDMALPTIPGTFFYRRKVFADDLEGAWELHFGGVQNSVWVWLNGTFLGCHRGYSTPFFMNIPEGVFKKENTLVMAVSNLGLTGFEEQNVSGLTNRASCQYTGGVTGDVTLRCYPTPLRDLSVATDEDCRNAAVLVERVADVPFRWQILDGDRVIREGNAQGDFSFAIGEMTLWSPENPKRYILRLICGESVLQRSFGLRRLTVEGTGLRLNGQPYYLRGVCEHCYYPITVHPSDDLLYYRNIVRKFKELGFNFIRFHTHVPHETYMQAADELGMLIQVESPNYASVEEYDWIVRTCRRHPSVAIYCCGNELEMDEAFIGHLAQCAELVHSQTDGLFSPMSALRGVEYFWSADTKDNRVVTEPFLRNPPRQEWLNRFCDLYNSYTLGHNSYNSVTADAALVDSWSYLYNKPRLSHEIGIHGTYTDLSLARRYGDSPVGRTEMFSSVEKTLREKGLLEKAPLFFANSCRWQQLLRKHCFEQVRRSETLAGYDFLGPIDTHWHTFGYDVGMMNEFYEMKPGETVRDVRMYNGATVLLSDLGTDRVFRGGDAFRVGVSVSHFGETALEQGQLTLRLTLEEKLLTRIQCQVQAEKGKITPLWELCCDLPQVSKPGKMKLQALLECGDLLVENAWDLYLFPEAKWEPGDLVVDPTDGEALLDALKAGQDVLMLTPGPLKGLPTSFQIALAGRTAGNLATVIADHPAMEDFPHAGFCGWQFRRMLEGGTAVVFPDGVPFDPIVEMASTHKNPIRQAMLFECRVGTGRLLVCGFHLEETNPAAGWLKAKLAEYAQSASFQPAQSLTEEQLRLLLGQEILRQAADTNRAMNLNDKAAIRRKRT